MKKALFFTSFLLASLSFSAQAAEKLTETSVKTLIENVKESARSREIERFASYLKDDVTITINLPEKMGGKTTTNKKEYLTLLKQGWSTPAEHKYEVKDFSFIEGKTLEIVFNDMYVSIVGKSSFHFL